MELQLHPAVRLYPPAADGTNRWTAEHLLERRRFTLPARAAALLVAAAVPRERDDLLKVMAEADRREPPAPWDRTLDELTRLGLVVPPAAADAEPRTRWLRDLVRTWSRYEWREAAEYHAMTFDYPCLDYTDLPAATAVDRRRMQGYAAAGPDDDRYTTAHADRPLTELPDPAAGLLPENARDAWAGTAPTGRVDRAAVIAVLSLTFGVTGRYQPVDGSPAHFKRSSPSGGGRQPIDGYLLVLDVAGLRPGWHHVSMSPFGLRFLGGPDAAGLPAAFPDTVERFPFETRALVVLTSTFERNMWRYREPRTFRTVHMDAGHLAGTMSVLARTLGLRGGTFFSDDAHGVERTLGLDGMREGYLLTFALADGEVAR